MTDAATLPPPVALKPARQMAEALPIRWDGESADYRQARTALLAGEIELRRQIQRVAQQRRALPPGPVAKDYRFLDEQGNELGLVDLFGRHETLFTQDLAVPLSGLPRREPHVILSPRWLDDDE